MKAYCFDTSGISNPLETTPRDIHEKMWNDVLTLVTSGRVAVTKEVLMIYIPSGVGEAISNSSELILLEVGQGNWNWQTYIDHSNRMQDSYSRFISEFNGNTSDTIGLNDLSIICLAKTLNLPLVSMEKLVGEASSKRRRIPDICKYEGIQHLEFNDFLRKEEFKF